LEKRSRGRAGGTEGTTSSSGKRSDSNREDKQADKSKQRGHGGRWRKIDLVAVDEEDPTRASSSATMGGTAEVVEQCVERGEGSKGSVEKTTGGSAEGGEGKG